MLYFDLTFFSWMVIFLSGDKKNVIPKLNWRRIGDVNIFELEGIFSEPWIKRSQQEMTSVLTECPSRGLLFNLRSLVRLDSSGAKLILDTTRLAPRGGIVGQNLSSYFVSEQMNPNECIPIFENETEAIRHFGSELAQDGKGPDPRREKRLFPRIKTALPVELEWREGGARFKFEAVVLNLSEGGLYGRFLNSKTEAQASKTLDPFDLKMLTLGLLFPDQERIKISGKVLRTGRKSDPGAFAVEFYDLGTPELQKIRGFLENQTVL